MKQKIERVGIWIRVSTSMQADSDSPEHHLHRACSYAEQQGWTVAEVYRLDGVSGRTVHEHSEMARMRADVESGRIQGLIFSSLTRLARKKSTLWELAELFHARGAALICLDMAIDTSTPAGELVFSIFGALAEWEAQLTAERISKSTITRAKMGKTLGGEAVFGYQWIDGVLKPNPKEAPVRRLIYELYADHQNYSEVARQLNKRGYTTRHGKEWSAQNVCNLISEPTAKGEHISNRINPRSKRKTHGYYKPKSEWISSPVEPVVDPELWERCNAIAGRRRVRRPENATYPLSGLVYCSCGGKMYHDHVGANMTNPKYRCLKCRSAFPASALLGAFREMAWEYFDPRGGQRQRDMQRKINNSNALLKNQKSELAKLQAAVGRIEQDYLGGMLTADKFEALSKKLEHNIKIVESEVAELQGQIDALNTEQANLTHSSEQMQRRLIKWDDLEPKEQNELARLITRKIEYDGDEILIEIEHISET